jgi:hypothetical protein
MRETFQASIPEKITIVTAANAEVVIGAQSPYYAVNHAQTRAEVLPAIAIASTEKKIFKRAKKEILNIYSTIPKTRRAVSTVEIDNITIRNPPLLGALSEIHPSDFHIEHQGYLLSMKKDVFMEALIAEGVSNGILMGEYIFATINSDDLKLIRIGSPLHKLVIASHQRQTNPKIPITDMKPGEVFVTKKGVRAVFLGLGKTKRATLVGTDFEFSHYPIKQVGVFYNLGQTDSPNTVNRLRNSAWVFKTSIEKTSSFVEKIGFVELKPNLIEKIQLATKDKIIAGLFEYAGIGNVPSLIRLDQREFLRMYIESAKELYLSEISAPEIEIMDIRSTLLFI